ncbi:MAG: hypothetical protein NTX50_29320 [Candidatus Sumerlaeota bacterium]|nr:hypothetical protein [Candidatus Sumerlaeota bacterium]
MHLPKHYSHIIALGLFLSFWFGLFGSFGLFSSDYDMMDDHELLSMNDQIHVKNAGFWNTVNYWNKRDISIVHRFRPAYYLLRLAETFFFKDNLLLPCLWRALLISITSFLLYAFFINLKHSWLASFAFPLICFLGYPLEAWFRRGPAEAPACLFMAASLFFLSINARKIQRSWLCEAAFLISAIVMCLCKENFILIIPAIVFLKIWQFKEMQNVSWRQAFLRELASSIFLLVTAAGAIICIHFLNMISTTYAGIDATTMSIRQILKTCRSLDQGGMLDLTFLVLGVFAAWQISWRRNASPSVSPDIKSMIPLCLFCLMLIGPQIIIYAKTSFLFGRYLLPAGIGLAFFCVWVLRHARERFPFAAWIIAGLLLCYCFQSAYFTAHTCYYWKLERSILNAGLHQMRSNLAKDQSILVVGDPVIDIEWFLSMLDYASKKIGHPENLIYAYPISDGSAPNRKPQEDAQAISHIMNWYNGRKFDLMSNTHAPQCILVSVRTEKPFAVAKSACIHLEDYTRKDMGYGMLYYKTDLPK